jgi:putative membrane-bound dehydrogenase-like protein
MPMVSSMTRGCLFIRVSMMSFMTGVLLAQIPEPTDAPQPLAPDATAASYVLPEGYQLEVVASEPLLASPTGVCWDHRGNMFVSELHGYNLEGQLDIEELNRTGKLDTQVRRVQADEKFKQAAKSGTFGVVKRLRDQDGDGRMDQVDVWANDLPPAYGLVPYRDGVIVACAPDIVYLADADQDGTAEIRQTLFSGFNTGALERGINAPQWFVDGWIYFGRGWGGSTITGPGLTAPVVLPDADFRIKPDGSAIESVTGGTHTFGFALTAAGDRFVVNTTLPAIYIAPLPWRYLTRNPNVAISGLDFETGDRRAWSISPPHPWRQKRADDAEYFEYYNSRYGAAESQAEGWFTAACGPMIYEDEVMPELTGQYFVCEPAGNLVHRGVIRPTDSRLEVARVSGEEKKEFAASSDPWSHPVQMSRGPDGAIWVVDFYREIIEDYSAIPRHLQQQYGLYNGHDRGRIYRIVHREMPDGDSVDFGSLDPLGLVNQLSSPIAWRRETAMRLLNERSAENQSVNQSAAKTSEETSQQVTPQDSQVAKALRAIVVNPNSSPSSVIASIRTLDAIDRLIAADVVPLLQHNDVAVRVHAWQLSERWLAKQSSSVSDGTNTVVDSADESSLQAVFAAAEQENDPRVR